VANFLGRDRAKTNKDPSKSASWFRIWGLGFCKKQKTLCLRALCVRIKMDWKEELKEFIDDKTAIMGIGSKLKTDDGVGVFISEKLKNMGIKNVIVAEATPEHWLGFLAEKGFEKLLIIDSVLFGGEIGEIKFFDLKEISRRFGLTHSSSLHLFYDFISTEGSIKELKILAVMPESLEVGENLTPSVRKSADEIIRFFCE
jgi:hydrogenase maturation protease